jgi:hypothetical protein
MNRIEANAFATNWIKARNKKDVDAVLEHYVEDARFISPKAASIVGNPVIEGRRRYRNTGISKEDRKDRVQTRPHCLGFPFQRTDYFLRGESQRDLQPCL